jgi:hypothetical protein
MRTWTCNHQRQRTLRLNYIESAGETFSFLQNPLLSVEGRICYEDQIRGGGRTNKGDGKVKFQACNLEWCGKPPKSGPCKKFRDAIDRLGAFIQPLPLGNAALARQHLWRR